ncbi:hypothetical protein [uncultured Alistipes sp.]|jgi:hypothetical protein|uniref:hypothetical protein n=1 Tax=uncultured Alistipes sp. TaxID=538949 RepID=UPI0025E359B7|nr:hypothetical protein [uncultured Alistipes sp.]
MRKFLFILSAFFISATSSSLYADNNYKKYAQELRETVWNWNISAFKDYSVPERYSNESAVIIARHEQLEATGKNRFRFSTFLAGSMSKELYYRSIDRIMIKLNDKKALDEYSELSFREEVKRLGYVRSNKLKTIVGARIIKPDGTIREIDVDEDAVVITEGKNDKESFKKLAIKGLGIGDILDYFFSEEMELETYNVPPQTFLFFSRHPTLSYSAECILEGKLTVEYRSINGAPDFERTTENKNTILKIGSSDLQVIDNVDQVRWLSAYRSLPMIRLMILNNSSKLIYKPASARKSGVYKDVGYDEILNDAKGELAVWSDRMLWMNNTYKNVYKAIANFKQKTPGATDEELAAYIYDALRFYWPSDYFNYPAEKFHIALEKILKENGLECKVCFVTSRYGARKEEVVSSDDISAFVSANNNTQLFFFPNGFRAAAEIPPIYEGEEMTSIAVYDYKPRQVIGIEGVTITDRVPESTIDQNKKTTRCEVHFDEETPGSLKILRSTAISGEMKDDYLKLFALYEDWDKLMRKRLLIETDFWQDLVNNRTDRKYIDQYETYFADKRKEQRETAEGEFKAYHSTNSGELIDFAVKNIGATAEAPLFEFETQYIIDGLVQQAGDNLVLNAGRLIGAQWTPEKKERDRGFDAYIESPILIENEISVTLPEQYAVDGLENLNMHIDNEFGYFSSSASVEGSLLKIKTTKTYKKNFVPANDWKAFLEMLDGANEFYARSVVLKYNNASN